MTQAEGQTQKQVQTMEQSQTPSFDEAKTKAKRVAANLLGRLYCLYYV